MPRRLNASRPSGANAGANYDPVGAIAAIFAGHDANPVDLTRQPRRRPSADRPQPSATSDLSGGAVASAGSRSVVVLRPPRSEACDLEVPSRSAEAATQTDTTWIGSYRVDSTAVCSTDGADGKQHLSEDGPSFREPSCSHAELGAHGDSAHRGENSFPSSCPEVGGLSGQTGLTAHVRDVCTVCTQTDHVTPCLLDAEVQAGELDEARAELVVTSTQTELLRSTEAGIQTCCPDEAAVETVTTIAVGLQATADQIDAATQSDESAHVHFDPCHKERTPCIDSSVQTDDGGVEFTLLEQIRGLQGTVENTATLLRQKEVQITELETMRESLQSEGAAKDARLRDTEANVAALESCLKATSDRIKSQEQALLGLEQLGRRLSEEQALNVRQKRATDDAKKEVERQAKEIQELRLQCSGDPRGGRSAPAAGGHDMPTVDELQQMLDLTTKENAQLRAQIRDIADGGSNAASLADAGKSQRHPLERSSSQPLSALASRRETAGDSSRRARSGSLPPVNTGNLMDATAAARRNTASRPAAPAMPKSALPPLAPSGGAGYGCTKAKITTLADIGRG
eukprot:TRINITY_DN18256_c0_g1_i2.p1 TRINITY_DN18256_c0_g1~~TRINITY_DN18256_c0_g1_i2.p1  ORF type:complete len:618 (-),score=98.09 TRINITY_DN18256_c0_g1_i2:6-1718(-)